MNKEESDSRERLLAAQSQDPQLRSKHQKEVRDLLSLEMNRPAKWLWAAYGMLFVLAAVVTAISLAHTESDDIFREILIPSLIFELAMAGCLAWVALRGGRIRSVHWMFMAFIVGNFCIMAVAFMNDVMRQAPADIQGKFGSIFGSISIVILIVGWLPMVLVVNSHYHERTREKLLEIQFQIAELADQIKRLK
jgi:hypothetical protein